MFKVKINILILFIIASFKKENLNNITSISKRSSSSNLLFLKFLILKFFFVCKFKKKLRIIKLNSIWYSYTHEFA